MLYLFCRGAFQLAHSPPAIYKKGRNKNNMNNLPTTQIQAVELIDYNFVTNNHSFKIDIKDSDGTTNTFIYMLYESDITNLLNTPDIELSMYTLAIKNYIKTNNLEQLKTDLLTKEFKSYPGI